VYGYELSRSVHKDYFTFRDQIRELFDYRDLVDIINSGWKMSYQAALGHHANDTGPPRRAMDIKERTITFEWKAFLNDFYKDLSYVQQRSQINESMYDLAEQSKNDLYSDCNDKVTYSIESEWIRNFAQEYDALFAEAYVHRLRHAHAEEVLLPGNDISGPCEILKLSPGKPSMGNVRDHVHYMRIARNRLMNSHYLQQQKGIDLDELVRDGKAEEERERQESNWLY
jgi:hypothetical protein